MELYSKNNIEFCTKRVFGEVNMFAKYELDIKDESGQSTNLRIIGKEKIKKNFIYMQINEFDFLIETKKIGKQLYDLFIFDIVPFVQDYGDALTVNYSIVKYSRLSEERKEVMEILIPFFTKYGMPIDYVNFCSTDDAKHTDSIDLNNLCTIFLLIYIVSDIAFNINIRLKIDDFCKLFNLNSSISKEKLMEEILNPLIFLQTQLGVFNLKFEKMHPIYFTRNIFSFAFERIKLNIIEKKGDENILVRHCKCGNLIIEENIKGKNGRAKSLCEECIIADKKNYNNLKSKKHYKHKAKIFHELKSLEKYIEEKDLANIYSDLLIECSNIKKIKDVKIKEHDKLYKKLKIAKKFLLN